MTTQSQQRSIFLVDDDQDDREMFTAALGLVDSDVSLIEFGDGQQLMDALTSNPSDLPDFIFLDLNMPKCGGMECIEKMAQLDLISKTTVAVLSTSSNPDSIEKARLLGATYYIVKPTSFSNLKRFIAKVLEEGSAEESKSLQEFLLAV